MFPLTVSRATDPFIASVYAISKEIVLTGRVNMEPPNLVWAPTWVEHIGSVIGYPGTELFSAAFCLVTGMPLDTIVYLPLYGIPMIALVYLIGSKLGGTPIGLVYAFAFSLCTAYFLSETAYQLLGFVGHALVVLLVLRIIAKGAAGRDILLLSLTLATTTIAYYAASLFNMVFLLGCATGQILVTRSSQGFSVGRTRLGAAALLSAVMYFFLDSKFFSMIPNIGIVPAVVYDYLQAKLFGLQYAQEGFLFSSPQNLLVSGGSVISDVILVVVPTLYLAYATVVALFRRRMVLPVTLFVMLFGFVATGAVETIAYAITGGVTRRYFWYFAMPLALYLVFRLVGNVAYGTKIRRLIGRVCVLSMLMIILFTSYQVFYAPIVFSDYSPITMVTFKYADPVATWVSEYFQDGSVVSDHQVSSTVFFKIVDAGKVGQVSVATLWSDAYPFYDSVSGANATELHTVLTTHAYTGVIMLSMFESKAMYGDLGRYMTPPLDGSMHNLNNFTSLSKVYDDSLGELYMLNQ
jgi:hypothetical protein